MVKLEPTEVRFTKTEGSLEIEIVEQDGYYEIHTAGFGTGVLTVKTADTEYTMPVRSELPWIGLYSSTVRSEESYLPNPAVTNTNNVLYLLVDENSALESLKVQEGWKQYVKSIVLSEDGTCATITVNTDALTDQHTEIRLDFVQKNGGGSDYRFSVADDREKLYWGWNNDEDDYRESVMSCSPICNRHIRFYYGKTSDIQNMKLLEPTSVSFVKTNGSIEVTITE